MVHCLATSKAWGIGKIAAIMMTEVTRWHTKDRGWRAVAYAAIVDYIGGYALGRDLDSDGNVLEETAAAAKGWNTNAIHLAIAGGHGSNENDKFTDHYTPEQDRTLRAMIAEIEAIAGRKMKVIGHNQVAAKACPGFNVPQWFVSPPLMTPRPQEKGLSGIAAIIAAILALFKGKGTS